MILSLIAALAENRVIGNKDRIPWHITDDLLHFKHLTLHHTVIMGRKTFDSLLGYYKKSGRALPERRHIIVSRDAHYTIYLPGCFIVNSIENALKIGVEKEREANGEDGEVFVSGGASLFEQTINKANRLHLTLVHKRFEGDAHFPDYSAFTKVIRKEDKKTEDGLAYTFLDLEK